MQVIYLIFLAAGTVATLIAGLKYQRWTLTGLSAGLGFIWATLGHSIEFNTGQVVMVMRTPQLVLVAWLVTAIGVAFTMLGIISYAQKRQGAAAS